MNILHKREKILIQYRVIIYYTTQFITQFIPIEEHEQREQILTTITEPTEGRLVITIILDPNAIQE